MAGPNPGSRRGRFAPYALISPGLLWLLLFFLVPLASLARMSLSTKQSRFDFDPSFTWDWGNYADVFQKYGVQLGRSFLFAAAATVLCLLIGYPMAYWVAFRAGRWRNVLIGMVVVPFFTSFLLRTVSWTVVLADDGLVLRVLRSAGVVGVLRSIGLTDGDRLLDTPLAVIGGLTYNFLPFMVLPIYVSLEKIDTRLVDAANDLYATGSAAFRRVVLPLSLPGVFAGSLLTFIPASGDFVNAFFLGGTRSRMIGNVVQDRFLVQLDYPGAAAISLVLMAIITSAVLLYAKLLGTEELA
ncbi:MAG: ABC transporter permease [Acidimicrobiales bacterium]|nr:ABC transporter permease [Acidimicrobiales bacterium]